MRTKESNTCASFCANAWICACQATDRDFQTSSTRRKANAWMCALLTTDRDPASVILDKKRKSVTTVIFADLMFFELISSVTFFTVLFSYLRNVL